ncbi:MAG: amidohydrolase family protein [Pirellulales bacterium]
MDAIDAHVHVWTPDTAHYPLAAGFKRDDMQPPSFTPEQLLDHAQPNGVQRIVLVQMSFYGHDNSYLLDSMQRFPGTLGGIAVIDTGAARPEAEMFRLAERGVRGFRVFPKNEPVERWAETKGLERMFAAGAEANLAMCCLINPNALPSLGRMCRRFPETPVVIDHLCRIGVDGMILAADAEALCALAVFPRVQVKVSAFYALGKKRPPHDDLAPLIRRVYDAYGPRRLMWGTDCPYQVQTETYADSIRLVRDRLDILSDADRAWLLGKTAEALFFRAAG